MPNEERPETLDDYYKWAITYLDTDFWEPRYEKAYGEDIGRIKQEVERHDFYLRLEDFLGECQTEYASDKEGAELFMSQPGERTDERISVLKQQPELRLLGKPYKSAVEKSFRYNILDGRFPDEPEGDEERGIPGGWLTPSNWFQILQDSVRTMIVCKYKDGPEYIADKLDKYAAGLGLGHRSGSREKDYGYYAFHFYVTFPCKLSEKLVRTNVAIEIQITTQLQEALYQISHLQYERDRTSSSKPLKPWQWDFQSPRFKIGYLSHTLHFLEAILLETREQKLKGV
jgi:hypothetical protein